MLKKRLAEIGLVLARDALGVLGAALIVCGVWSIFKPAGLIVAGAFLLGLAVLIARADD